MKIIKNKKCRACGSTKFKQVIDLGETPLFVNNLLTDPDGEDPTYPLVVEQCQKCFLSQILDTVEADDLYHKTDYLFFSSDMPNLADYFKKYAQEVKKYLNYGDFVVEIGSNDGVFLQHMREYNVLGVDPATNVVLRALKKGIPTLSEFFSEQTARRIKEEWGQANLITGFNCIAHIDDLDGIMRGVKSLLTDKGVFVVECNYWGDMIRNTSYSLIYHDHFSYFTLKNWVDYVKKFGMNVFDAMIPPAQGDTDDPKKKADAFNLRVFIDKGEREPTQRMKQLLEEEADLHSYETVEKYAKDCKAQAKKFGDLVRKLKTEGKTIAGYGASAKAFTVFKLAEINKEVDYFVDDSLAKQGKYAPISHIPIQPRTNQNPDYFLITAPNYINVILNKEREYIKNGGKFITIEGEIINE